MDQLSETTRRVVEILIRDWILWVAILSVVLAFALYLYFNPRATEFFTGAPKQKSLGELAAEDKEQPAEEEAKTQPTA